MWLLPQSLPGPLLVVQWDHKVWPASTSSLWPLPGGKPSGPQSCPPPAWDGVAHCAWPGLPSRLDLGRWSQLGPSTWCGVIGELGQQKKPLWGPCWVKAIGPDLKCPPWPPPSLPGSHPQPPSGRCRLPRSEAPRVCHPPTCSPSAECSGPHPPWTCRRGTSSSRGPWVSSRWGTSSPWLHLHPPHASRHSQGPSSPMASRTS